MTVTFVGHSDAPDSVRESLAPLLIELIKNYNAETFYVGNNGRFDIIVARALEDLKQKYPHIKYAVVLAYFPRNSNCGDTAPTVYPEGLELVPPRFAICKRNEWMIDRSEMIVAYVTRDFGGAAKYKRYALRKKKTVIDLI